MSPIFLGLLLTHALATSDGFFQHNCFKRLKEPLTDAPFNKDEILRLTQHFWENFDVNGTGAIIASPGTTPALPSGCVGGYKYHWIRDGALSMSALLHTGEAFELPDWQVEETFMQYVAWVQTVHTRAATTVDEPKWNIAKAAPYAFGWCRPQTDGPPLRARTLLQAARRWRRHRRKLWQLAKKDLDWLIANSSDGTMNMNKVSCDVWEETTSDDFFWNKAMMQAALLEGILFSSEVGDTERVQSYSNALQALGNTLETHKEWSLMGSFITECPPGSAHNSCAEYRKRIDGAVILGLVHGRTMVPTNASLSSAPLPTDVLVANTIRAYNKEFCSLYALNQEESGNGRPGILYGRYAADKYGGEDGGNPWVLITAALANLLYQAASQVSHTALNLEERAAWKIALNDVGFSGEANDFIAAGDSVLVRLREHISAEDDMHLFEQIHRDTGLQYNAKDLTWSYAEVLNALVARKMATKASFKMFVV